MKYIYTLGIIITLLTSCKFDSKKELNDQAIVQDTTSTEKSARIELEVKSQDEGMDTLSVQDRKLMNGTYHSYIKLEFAEVGDEKIDTNQTHIFEGMCAVSVIPDTAWINAQQKELGRDWNEIVSDNVYYESLATDTLEKLDIPTLFASRDKQYICFKKLDNSNFTLDLKKMEDAWGLILFNGNDNPVFWSDTDIESEIKEIFNK